MVAIRRHGGSSESELVAVVAIAIAIVVVCHCWYLLSTIRICNSKMEDEYVYRYVVNSHRNHIAATRIFLLLQFVWIQNQKLPYSNVSYHTLRYWYSHDKAIGTTNTGDTYLEKYKV